MNELNLSIFNGGRKHWWWQKVASGFQLDGDGQERIGADGCVVRNGGIKQIQEASLKVGRTYYRFLDAIKARDKQRGEKHIWGWWWIDWESLDYFMRLAAQSDQYLGDILKAKLAVPYEWGAGDQIVAARLVKPLRVMMGYGMPAAVSPVGSPRAHSADRGVGYTPGQDLMQIFIPGLTPDLAKQAFAVEYLGYVRRYTVITSRCKVL